MTYGKCCEDCPIKENQNVHKDLKFKEPVIEQPIKKKVFDND